MSVKSRDRALTPADIRAAKGRDEPLVCLTAYTAPVAKALDEHVELLLVGDSLAMVIYGLDSTLGVTLEMMIAHGQAVTRGARRACVVVDMPFGAYEESPQAAFRNAARVMKETGCAAVKLEAGAEMAETVRYLCERGVPVMGHVGLMPQRVNALGGYRARGRDADEGAAIVADAKAIAEAGAFAIVLEGVLEPIARTVTAEVDVPIVGIGASPACDGQILVTDDMVGLFTEFTPKFVKRYAELNEVLVKAAAAYASDVRTRTFPGPEHCFQPKPASGQKS
jgi:3-methyl-2-oxobutanoate hydroxymethyltransferase